MSKKITIALDAMGGDNAPLEVVLGALLAVNNDEDIIIKLVGNKLAINEILKDKKYNKDQIEVIDAKEVVLMSEDPIKAIRNKKDSSLVKAIYMVKNNEADAVLSAGNTGALLVGGQIITGLIKGVQRPCLVPVVPKKLGPCAIVDGGANMDAKSSWLVQWGIMASTYMKLMFDIKEPKVALVNVGIEEEKGNTLTKETYQLLKNTNINFIGNIEARDISFGKADIIVCDAFVGNVILKMYEGVAKMLLDSIKEAIKSSVISSIGGLLVKNSMKQLKSTFNAQAYGGAILLGSNGVVVKGHGNSKAKQIQIALKTTANLIRKDIVLNIKKTLVDNEDKI